MKAVIPFFFFLTVILCAEEPAGWTDLFDGKSLAGWTSLEGGKPGKGWTVQDGQVQLDGPGGNLLSAKEYASFELEWEWKIAEGGNNGLKYWVTKVGGKEWLGLEYQMLDDAKHPDGKIGGHRTTASLYDIKAPAEDKPLLPPGQWNRSRVVVKDGRIQHHLNGKLVLEADARGADWPMLVAKSKFRGREGFAPGKGRIMLTDHGDRTWFRAIRIREL